MMLLKTESFDIVQPILSSIILEAAPRLIVGGVGQSINPEKVGLSAGSQGGICHSPRSKSSLCMMSLNTMCNVISRHI